MNSLSNIDELSRTPGKVAVLFSAPWCGPCKQLHVAIEKKGEYFCKVPLYSCCVDEQQHIASFYGVRCVPCLIVLEDGEVTDKLFDPGKILSTLEKLPN